MAQADSDARDITVGLWLNLAVMLKTSLSAQNNIVGSVLADSYVFFAFCFI
jgi:hypothetical protein